MPLALALFALAIGWRIVGAHVPELANFAPLMALTFCGGVYFRDRRMWLVPFAALAFSDLYLDHYYATTFNETWAWPSVLIRLACFAMSLGFGWAVARRKNWLTLASGGIGSSIFFYLVTNTDAWLRDPAYIRSAAGWWQAMTVGRPEYPPTLFFFRNTFVSDLLFTAAFVLAMEYVARREGQPNLLTKRQAA